MKVFYLLEEIKEQLRLRENRAINKTIDLIILNI